MRTDERIKTDVVDQMYWDSRIDASNITIEVDSGQVKLNGNVPTFTAKQAAYDDAWVVSGVTTVENDLEVEPSQTKVEVPSDEQIQANIKNTFQWNPDLAAYKVDVTVKNGWAELSGTVDAYWKKVQAESDALSVNGVLGVTNNVAVVPTEKITDESIAEDVVNALERNLEINADNVDVTVRDGTVRLDGTVTTLSAKSAANNAALYTRGVVAVEDNLVVSSQI
jgi:osmotically-inducible protein OsmY